MEGCTTEVSVIWYPKGTHQAVKLPPVPIRGLFLSDFFVEAQNWHLAGCWVNPAGLCQFMTSDVPKKLLC